MSESEFRFLDFSTTEFEKNFPTGIFGIKNGIRIPLPMGVPEIGTKNWNSQPSNPCLKHFDHQHLVMLRSDFSSKGFGYVICQPTNDVASTEAMNAY
jgi:hypothetical protein